MSTKNKTTEDGASKVSFKGKAAKGKRDNIHKKESSRHWNNGRIQRTVLSQIVSEIGLFANKEKDKNLTKCIRELHEQMSVITIPTKTMYNWYVHYQQYGEIPAETMKNGRQSYSGKWKNEEINHIVRIVQQFPQFYLDEISNHFHARFPKRKQQKSDVDIWRCLHDHCNYRLKVCTEVALQRNELERDRFRLALQLMTTNVSQLIIIDETSKDQNSARRRRMWALKGDKAELRQVFNAPDDENYTMIAASDISGFIPQACELVFKGDNSINPARGTIDSQRMIDYVRYYLCPVLGNYALREPRSVVILDNVNLHKHPDIKQLINETGAEVLFTARYSPDLSPIEYFFNLYKKELKRQPRSMSTLERHRASIYCVSEQSARNTFAHCGYPGVERNEIEGVLVGVLMSTGLLKTS